MFWFRNVFILLKDNVCLSLQLCEGILTNSRTGVDNYSNLVRMNNETDRYEPINSLDDVNNKTNELDPNKYFLRIDAAKLPTKIIVKVSEDRICIQPFFEDIQGGDYQAYDGRPLKDVIEITDLDEFINSIASL